MTLTTLFDSFDELADAPGAVENFRELVLRLATSGRITDQDPADPPASRLLEEIFAVRDNLIQRGAAKGRLEGSPIAAGDTFDLPESWARCMISEVCDLQTGATPSRQEARYFGGDIPWLVSGDVNRGEIIECEGRITDSGMRNSNCKLIPPHSVLIALNGQGKTRATVALLRIAAALNQSLVAMIPYSGARLLPEYLFWNLRGRYYAIRDITGQDQRRGLNMKLIGQLSLPVPPIAEQQRIVAKVDELMALCDRLEAQQGERKARHAALSRAALARFGDAPTSANLAFLFHDAYTIEPADLRKAILTLAVQGKLVPQDPNDESSTDLTRQHVLDTVGSALNVAQAPFEVPPGWRWCRLGDLQPDFQNGASSRGDRGGVPVVVLRLADIVSRRISLENTRELNIEADDVTKYALHKGDILITRVNGSAEIVGRFVLVDADVSAIYCDHFIRMRLGADVAEPRFIELLGATELVREQVAAVFITTAGQKTVNQEHIKSLFVVIPPLAEQCRIVAKVDELSGLLNEWDTRLAASRATAANLLEAVVAELTSQA